MLFFCEGPRSRCYRRTAALRLFSYNGTPVERNWQGKTEVLGEKPIPVSLCLQQIPHGLTWDRSRVSAVGGRRLTAWALARPNVVLSSSFSTLPQVTAAQKFQFSGIINFVSRDLVEIFEWGISLYQGLESHGFFMLKQVMHKLTDLNNWNLYNIWTITADMNCRIQFSECCHDKSSEDPGSVPVAKVNTLI